MHYLLCVGMYENSNNSRIEEKIQNVDLLKTSSEEKKFVDKKYTS
jgi:hypothetical protein